MKPLSRTVAPTKLMMNDDSRVITKPKPKIRIIHLVEPEIITTDAKNFRELVQKLTGKQEQREHKTNKRTIIESSKVPFVQTANMEREEMCGMENPNAFLSFLEDVDVDGFMHEMSEFPLLPPFISSRINTFGRSLWCDLLKRGRHIRVYVFNGVGKISGVYIQ